MLLTLNEIILSWFLLLLDYGYQFSSLYVYLYILFLLLINVMGRRRKIINFEKQSRDLCVL